MKRATIHIGTGLLQSKRETRTLDAKDDIVVSEEGAFTIIEGVGDGLTTGSIRVPTTHVVVIEVGEAAENTAAG
jgi:hypothetical protein